MIGSYVLGPGRRSHALDLLALEFLQRSKTSITDLCGSGKDLVPFDRVPVSCARDYSCEAADIAWQLREMFEPQLDALQLATLFREIEMPLVDVLAEMEWHGDTIDIPWFASLKERFAGERRRVEQEIYAAAGQEFNINSNPQLREILFEKLSLPVLKKTQSGASRRTRAFFNSSPMRDTTSRCCSWSTVRSPSSRARTSMRSPATCIR